MPRWRRRAVAGAAIVICLWAGNSSWLHGPTGKAPSLLAHRGLAQTFPIAGLNGTEDTSKLIFPPEHPFIENTIASMAAAFEYGADIVELDIQRTADDRFAVFHDATLDYRTDGHGPIRAHALDELQRLDLGHGYSADHGQTFPFRGKGIGLMPSLDQVLSAFPTREFLLDVKGFDAADGRVLAEFLRRLPAKRLERLAAYGGDQPIQVLASALPSLRVMSKNSLVRGALEYLAIGWKATSPRRAGTPSCTFRYASLRCFGAGRIVSSSGWTRWTRASCWFREMAIGPRASIRETASDRFPKVFPA
jgi:glycerophosphoryl diester phosphodiesterase